MHPHLLLNFCSALFHLSHSWFSRSATIHIEFAPRKHLQAYCLAWTVLYWFDFFFLLLCSVLVYNISWCRQQLYGYWASLLIGFTSLSVDLAGSLLVLAYFFFPQKWKQEAAWQCYSTIHYFLWLPLCRPPKLLGRWEKADRVRSSRLNIPCGRGGLFLCQWGESGSKAGPGTGYEACRYLWRPGQDLQLCHYDKADP